MLKISFIIVNYKTPLLLEQCVDNLLEVWPHKEIIVVDNDSGDNSSELVKEKYSREKSVILVEAENKGISAGYNLGLKHATGDYFVFLGTDAFPSHESLEKLVEFMENPQNEKVGIATPMLVLNDGTIDWDAHRGLSTPWTALTHFSGLDQVFPSSKLFNGYFLGYKDFAKTHEIDVCISHFMLMRKEVMQQLKKWDEDYWVYGEDLDTCYRTQQLGYKIMYLPEIKVLHHKGATVGRKSAEDLKERAVLSPDVQTKLTKGSVLAMEIFYKKHLAERYPFFINWLVYLGIFCLRTARVFLGKH